MKSYLRLAFIAFVTCVAASSLNAATIIKLNLGGTGPDVSLGQAGTFGTSGDGNAATTGDQNTAIEYTGALDFIPDINTDIASFTLSGLQEAGPAIGPFGNVVIQNFAGGTFNLFDAGNILLLSGALTTSTLTGTLGLPATGSVFTTGPAFVTGGTLAPLIQQGTLSLSLTLTNVVSQGVVPGLVVDGGVLQFTADSTVALAATVVPEPATFSLIALGGLAAIGLRLRRR